MDDKEAMEVITQKLSKEFREQITIQLMRCEVGGFDWTDGRKASILLYTHFCYSLIKNYHLKV